ncbi:MAG: tRNA uridine-5-carboxymethylaminomethyl(34) synthesis GTPase MnmE [Nitrospirae bacterium]|nr:tRNA uridine-5-carboxymethylaminomethyl(34) synthesis GTPase MnmE [Nitrospirota bacterium]
MFEDDTIVAISTPLGEGGIGIVRLSGKDAINIAERLFHSPKGKNLSCISSHSIIHGFIKDPANGEEIDEVLISLMRSPNTYTKEDIVEINCHGGMSPLRKVLELVMKQGARLAEPGEFTKRAFLNGRIDLGRAEAVLDLIRAKTDESRKIALDQLKGRLSEKITRLRDRLSEECVLIEAYIDFSEEDIETVSKSALIESIKAILSELESLLKTYDEGRFFREGLAAAIVGKPNVGKSSLLNALLQKDRAIVTDIPGTTRDIIEEYLNINGLPLRIIDTAGIREAHNMAEVEGVKRSLAAIENADLVIAVVDGSEPLRNEDFEVLDKVKDKNAIIVMNKSDLIETNENLALRLMPYASCILRISATEGYGITELKKHVFDSCLKNWEEQKDGIIITNLRHKTAIQKACGSLDNALSAIRTAQPVEIIALEIRDALDNLGEIVGAVTTDEILNRIFSDFCIGK